MFINSSAPSSHPANSDGLKTRSCTQSETVWQSDPAGPQAARPEPGEARREDWAAPGNDFSDRDGQSGYDTGDDSDGAERPRSGISNRAEIEEYRR